MGTHMFPAVSKRAPAWRVCGGRGGREMKEWYDRRPRERRGPPAHKQRPQTRDGERATGLKMHESYRAYGRREPTIRRRSNQTPRRETGTPSTRPPNVTLPGRTGEAIPVAAARCDSCLSGKPMVTVWSGVEEQRIFDRGRLVRRTDHFVQGNSSVLKKPYLLYKKYPFVENGIFVGERSFCQGKTILVEKNFSVNVKPFVLERVIRRRRILFADEDPGWHGRDPVQWAHEASSPPIQW